MFFLYMDGIELYWNKICFFVLDLVLQFKFVFLFDFFLEKESDFYKEFEEVYIIFEEIIKEGEEFEGLKIV